MDKSRAEALLDKFPGKRIVVLGDVMLDEYIWGHVGRISPEAPVMVVEAERTTHVPGGAANVVNNVCALGAKGIMAGVIGEDDAGRLLTEALQAEGAQTDGLIAAAGRPTTRKTRVIAHSQHESQQILRVDHEQRAPIDDALGKRLAGVLADLAAAADAILLSDYQKGVLTPLLLTKAPEFGAQYKIPVTGNLKPSALLHLGSANESYTLLTLNHFEAAAALEDGLEKRVRLLDTTGHALLQRTFAKHILITQGAKGLTLFSANHQSQHVPGRPVEVYDSAGAGDTVISVLTLALACGATPLEAVQLANYAAAETVKKVGVATVKREEILESID